VLVLAVSLSACATKKYAGCPEFPRVIEAGGDAVVVGKVNIWTLGPSNFSAAPSWSSTKWTVSRLETLKSSLGPIPETFTVVGRIYIGSPEGEPPSPIIRNGVVLGVPYLAENSVSVMVLKRLPADLADEFRPANYELIQGSNCDHP
jgi:hypothetical protein